MGLFDGLFEKKYCSVCGGKAGNILDRCRLAGDRQYLCEDCQARCSQELLREGVSQLTADDIQRHIDYLETCEHIFDQEFEITDTFETEDDDEVILLDSNHGWWAINNSDDYDIFRTDAIGEVRFGETSHTPGEHEHRNCPSPREMWDIREKMGDDMPACPPDGRIEEVYVEVELLDHPWLHTTRIYLVKDEYASHRDVRHAYYDAVELMHFLRCLAGTRSDAVEDYA